MSHLLKLYSYKSSSQYKILLDIIAEPKPVNLLKRLEADNKKISDWRRFCASG